MEIVLAVCFIVGIIIMIKNSSKDTDSTAYRLGRGLGTKVKKIMDDGDPKKD